MELTQEQKQKIVDEVNSDQAEPESESNTSLFTMASLDELKPFLAELTPMEMFEKSVAINQISISRLEPILRGMSKRNIIKAFIATLKLPEKDAVLKFGGKQQDQQNSEVAFYQAQMARNALVHVLGTTAIAQAKLVKKRELEEAEALKQESAAESSVAEDINKGDSIEQND